MSSDEGFGTPHHEAGGSSPERTPGRSPEGHVANLLQEAEERSQRRAAAIRDVLESIRIAPPRLPGRPTVEASEVSLEAELLCEEPRAAPQALAGPETSQTETESAQMSARCSDCWGQLASCQLDAREARDALARCQGEAAAFEGRAAKREAELRQEIIHIRSQQAKECEKWRSENRRLQSSLKETQKRVKAENEAKTAAAEQVEVLRQQLAKSQRSEAKRLQEEKVKALEEVMQRYRDLLRWVALRCAEALGEECESLDILEVEEAVRLLLSRLIQQGPRAPPPPPSQCEDAKTERPETALHTQWRGRIRAAEQAQKNLRRLMEQEAEAHAAERVLHTEEFVELRLRVNALQRSKEASERYVEHEEDAWIRAKGQIQQAEAEVSSSTASAHHFEAEARLAAEHAIRAQAKQTAADAAQRGLQAELTELQRAVGAQRSPMPLQENLIKAQQRWHDVAAVEEVSEAQRQMNQWRVEAECSCAEVAHLRVCCERLQVQSEQAKVDEAQRIERALNDQVHGLCERSELEEKIREIQTREDMVVVLRAELSKAESHCSTLEQLEEQLAQRTTQMHAAEAAACSWEATATQQKLQLNEELLELHQAYAKRLNALRAQHGGEKRALEAVEDELRQMYSQELVVSQRNQEAWAEATEAALAGEAAEARLARKAIEEAESCRMQQHVEVQQQLQAQLFSLQSHLRGTEAPPGLHPSARELFLELCCSIQDSLCNEVLRNPCSDLRRSLCRDLKQELGDQLRSEVMSARSNEASTSSTTGSSRRRRTPASAIRHVQELTRRGALLMDAFTAAAEEAQMRQEHL